MENIFSASKELKMKDFMMIAREDDDFKNALVKIGIFQQCMLEQEFNEDMEEEFQRESDENLHGEEDDEYENRRLGLEEKKSDLDGFQLEEEEADQFMAIKPFLGVVKNSVPSDFDPSKVNLSEPETNLDLEFIHGYRCFDTRNNIFWADKENFFFHSAGVSVKMNIPGR